MHGNASFSPNTSFPMSRSVSVYSTYLPTYLPLYLPSYPPIHLPTYLLIYLTTHLPIYYPQTPLFIMQSKFDNWQRKYLYCGGEANVEGINTWGKAFEDMFWKVAGQDKDG